MKWQIIILLIIGMASIVSALDMCGDSITINTNCTMLTPALNCSITNYEIANLSGTVLVSENLTLLLNDIYQFNISLKEGDYIARLCDGSTREFRIEDEGANVIIAAIILLPMILGIIFLAGAVTLDNEQHKAMKIFLYLLSIVPFFASMHFGLLAVVKFYDFPELQELIGSTTYWVSIIFGLLITYFIIYLFTKMIHQAAQKKKERMKY